LTIKKEDKMSIKVKESYNAVVIEMKGKLVGGPLSSEFSHTLYDHLDKGKKNIVVDMGDITYVNSSGLGILISGLTSMRKNGGDLKLANINNKVEGLLSITKLNQIFEQFDSVDEAVKSYLK
jgi:anti-sigma B factor antagonist